MTKGGAVIRLSKISPRNSVTRLLMRCGSNFAYLSSEHLDVEVGRSRTGDGESERASRAFRKGPREIAQHSSPRRIASSNPANLPQVGALRRAYRGSPSSAKVKLRPKPLRHARSP